MSRFNHVPVNLPKLKTIAIDRKRFCVTPQENYYPSITTVLSIRKNEGLVEWRKRVGDKVANYVAAKAAARGTKVHHMCEDYLNNVHLDYPDKWKKHEKDFLPLCIFNQLRDKTLKNISDIYALECGLYSDKYKVAGRVDCIAKYNDVLSIIDFKTSTRERSDAWNENYYIQGSAYAEMFTELTGIDVSQVVILVVTEDGTVQEFIKEKGNFLDALTDSVDEWKKQNETDNTGRPITHN